MINDYIMMLIQNNKLNNQRQLMKQSINFYQQKKKTPNPTIKKTNYINSLIYKQVTTQQHDYNKSKTHKDSKETIKDKKYKDEEKSTIPSKKSSLNQLNKKQSKNDLSQMDFYNLCHKLTDNFMIDTQEQTRFEPQDTKQYSYQKSKNNSKEHSHQQLKKNNKYFRNMIELHEPPKVEKSLFNYLYIIGKGGFGKVWKTQHKKTKNQYAMKQMLKSIVMTKKSVQSVMNQRVLLSQFFSPFVVNMHFAFQDRDTLYLVLDLMEGGDLRYHIGNRAFNQLQSKFFVACIILGLEDLQKNHIIHRDIKPENLVLDSRGYIRITDLGIARIHKANNSCDTSGTPGYMSPEVICRMNHSFVSDYFAVGVIAYQLMTGKRPYNGRSRNEIREVMLAKNVQLRQSEIPQNWSYEAADFINRLIRRKPQNRLGNTSITELKNHPWLCGINWQKLRTKEIESPFIPMMKKSNFDQDEQITIQDEDEAQLIQKNSLLLRKPQFQELFNGYYYSKQDAIQDEQKQLKQRDKKINNQKRIVSAYRKSSHQEKEVKLIDLLPQKKLSYNDAYNKKKLDIQVKPQKYYRHIDNSIADVCVRDKKKSGQYERTFFR